jgi:cytochrome c peroxidase
MHDRFYWAPALRAVAREYGSSIALGTLACTGVAERSEVAPGPDAAAACVTPAVEDLDAFIERVSDNAIEPPLALPSEGGLGTTPGAPSGAGDAGAAFGDIATLTGQPLVANESGRGQTTTRLGPALSPLVLQLGTNQRHCETCHANEGGWSLRPEAARARFESGVGHSVAVPKVASNVTAARNDELEALFRTVDGSNSPLADVSSPEARASAYSLLLERGVIRVGLALPESREFDLVAVDDPYAFASERELSLFRRPGLMANLRLSTSLMWDGRQTRDCAPLTLDLAQLANDANRGHAQASADLEPHDAAAIVAAELSIYFAQIEDDAAGALDVAGARGGPLALSEQPFYPGINAFPGPDRLGRAYDPEVFDLYAAWRSVPGADAVSLARRRIAEGERLFNAREFVISGVPGFNDVLGREEIVATCGACHDAPNVGTSSRGASMDLGTAEPSRAAGRLPVYTLRDRQTGREVETTDPGRALISGRWRDLNRFKVPGLRGLASRPPYFHDGSAATLVAAIAHHDRRLSIGLQPDELDALAAFLAAL